MGLCCHLLGKHSSVSNFFHGALLRQKIGQYLHVNTIDAVNVNVFCKFEASLTCGQLFANSQCRPKRRTLYQRGSLQPPLYFLHYLYSIQSPSCICICICICIYVCIFSYDYICIFYNLYSLLPHSQI